MNLHQIKMACYATLLTNYFGLKLKKAGSAAEKRALRLKYAQKLLDKLNISIRIEQIEKIPLDKQFLLISNHRSIIDPLVVEIALESSGVFGHWVAKKELYNSLFFGLFTKNAGTILLDREAKQMSGFFKDIKTAVSEGDSIYIFPEGTRNKEKSTLSSFKEGSSLIARKNRLPILPVFIRTNSDTALKHAVESCSNGVEIVIEIGEMIDYKDRSISLEDAYRERFRLSN